MDGIAYGACNEGGTLRGAAGTAYRTLTIFTKKSVGYQAGVSSPTITSSFIGIQALVPKPGFPLKYLFRKGSKAAERGARSKIQCV